jgi:hypothetical protein
MALADRARPQKNFACSSPALTETPIGIINVNVINIHAETSP